MNVINHNKPLKLYVQSMQILKNENTFRNSLVAGRYGRY